MQSTRTSSSGSGRRARVRQRQRAAVRTSKVEQRRRCGGRWRRRAANSSAPKKKERWSISSRGTMVFLVSAISSYSWCVRVTCGGSLALRTSRPHTGGIDGAWAPRATSPTAVMNWTSPAASAMVWFSLNPNMNPPHFSLVTCPTITLISISTNFKI